MTLSEKKITVSDIAREAGVSRAAASMVLLGTGKGNVRVSAENERKIRSLADQLGYAPNLSAQILAGKKSGIVGVIIDSLAPSAMFECVTYLEPLLMKQGLRMLVGQVHDSMDSLRQYVEDFQGRNAEGIICFAHEYPRHRREVTTLFSEFSLSKIVFIGKPFLPDACSVELDLASGIRDAVRHLAQLGRMRPLLSLYDSGSFAMQDRLEGFKLGLADAGLAFSEELLVWLPAPAAIHNRQMAAELLLAAVLRDRGADALLSSHDETTAILLRLLVRQGVRVPEDLAIVGDSNFRLSRWLDPSLTTLDYHVEKMAEESVNFLNEVRAGRDIRNRKKSVKAELLPRESTLGKQEQ